VRGVYRLNVTAGEDYRVFTSGQPKEVDRMKVYVEDGVLILDQNKDKKKKSRDRPALGRVILRASIAITLTLM